MNALILGCGNMGAYYDWETDDVKTYAKACHILGVDFSVYDHNLKRSIQVAGRYGAKVLQYWDEVPLTSYDIVVISSPTSTHFGYLTTLLSKPPRLIICEKPVDLDFDRLEQIVAEYQRSQVRVMVNFHRRFQPKMLALARRVQKKTRVGQS